MKMFADEPEGQGPNSGQAMRAALERKLDDGPLAEELPPSVPDHELLERIGTGAYGDVWRARNALGTLRAVKVVYRARFEEERPYQREFHGILKYEPVSRSHEGLVQILHVGRNDQAGHFYYVMELADDANATCDPLLSGTALPNGHGPLDSERGTKSPAYRPRTLKADLDRGVLYGPRQAAQLALRLAGALAHLHAHGLVHRDIKPSNVIFVGGKPKLADIGLVTGVGDSRSFVGTEGFIPPEGPGTVQADLYSLGKLLYELATGRDRMDFPQLPTAAANTTEGQELLDLNEVLLRACAPEPQQRYATALQLQADLNLFLAGRSLRRVRQIEQHLVWLRWLATAACLLVAAGVCAAWLSRVRERQATERERTAGELARREAGLRHRAEEAERQARQQLAVALLEQARVRVRSGDVGHRLRALEAIRSAAAISKPAELRGVAMAAMALPDLQIERSFPMNPQTTTMGIDPQFQRLAMGFGNGPVQVVSAADQHLLAKLPPSFDGPVYLTSWSPDGRFLAIKRDHPEGSDLCELEVWEVESPRRSLLLRSVAYGAVCFHPRLSWVLASQRDGEVGVWQLPEGKERNRFRLHEAPYRLLFSPDGERFAAVAIFKGGSRVSVHHASDGQLIAEHVFGDSVSVVNWHPSGNWLGVADHSGSVHLMDSSTGETQVLGHHKAQAVCVAFSLDGGYLISGGWERELICWDMHSKEKVMEIGLGGFSLDFSADGRHCAIPCRTSYQICTFEPPEACRELGGELGGRIRKATFSSDGRWIAAGGLESFGVWDMNSPGSPPCITRLNNANEDWPVFLGETPMLFACSTTESFGWRVSAGPDAWTPPRLENLRFPGPQGFTSLCVASNQLVVTASRGSQVLAAGQLEPAADAWVPTSQGVTGASPDGNWLAIFRPFTPWLHVYRLPGLEVVATLTNKVNIGDFAFCPRTRELAVCAPSRVEFWQTDTWKHTRELPDFMGVVFAPEGDCYWLTKDYRNGGLYDARTLELLVPLPTGTLPLALSRDGRQLAVSVDARRVQVWDLPQLRSRFRELGIDWQSSKP